MTLVKQENTDKVLRVLSAEEIAIRGVGEQPTASSHTANLLGLPVELQKTILELVGSNLYSSQRSLY
jgi:hypothetical protein